VNTFSHSEGRTQIEGVSGQGADENIRIKEGGSGTRLGKTA